MLNKFYKIAITSALLTLTCASMLSACTHDDGCTGVAGCFQECMDDSVCEGEQRCLNKGASGIGQCRPVFYCADALDPDRFCDEQVSGQSCDLATNKCVTLEGCGDDAACASGERCLDKGANGRGVCRIPATCNEQADPTLFCATLSPAHRCDPVQRRCVVPASSVGAQYILIQDVSVGASACDPDDPGSDIMWAIVDDTQGEYLGSAEAVLFNEGTTSGPVPNAYNNPTFLNGAAPMIAADLCPVEVNGERQRPDSTVSLGCGGQLFVRFLDGDSNPVPLREGYEISVGEYAPFCNAAGGDAVGADRYEVSVCFLPAGMDAQELDASMCTYKLNNAQGGVMAPVAINYP